MVFVWNFLLPCHASGSAFIFSPVQQISHREHPIDVRANDGHSVGKQLERLLASAGGNLGGDVLNAEIASVARSGIEVPRSAQKTTFLRTRGDEQKANQQKFMEAVTAFDDAASHGSTPEEQATKRDLAKAMATPSTVGKPDHRLPAEALECQPDLMTCPRDWHSRGVLCYAGPTYAGPCAPEMDLFRLSIEEKLAFAQYCQVIFPCQEDCMQDFRSDCPSMWQQLDAGCSAPVEYAGGCNRFVDTSEMSDKDKFLFGVNCGARWACLPPPFHVYDDVCPQSWVLQFGQVCTSPNEYRGPCGHTVQMAGMLTAEKKQFEASCAVSWPVARAPSCVRDFTACPLGWLRVAAKGTVHCQAPLTFTQCSAWQDFATMSPSEKEEWQHVCGQSFPCRSRDSCGKDWSTPCPADWYALDGGLSCIAPTSYNGSCSTELVGLVDLSTAEKAALAARCSMSWPCEGEASDALGFAALGALDTPPRRPNDPANHHLTDGPVDHETGVVVR